MGTCCVIGNHWTLVVINLKSKEFLFMDPKGDMGIDYTCGVKYNNMWQIYCKVWNREHENLLPLFYTSKTLPHDMQPQADSNNCGIYTLMASISFVYFLKVVTSAKTNKGCHDHIFVLAVCKEISHG